MEYYQNRIHSTRALHCSLRETVLMCIALFSASVGAGAPVVIGVIGDYGNGSSSERSVAELVKSWNPDFIMTLGDNNYPAGLAEDIDKNIGQFYHEFIHPYQGSYGEGAVSNRFFPALGNHDYSGVTGIGDAGPYLSYFTLPGNERYYSYRDGPVEIFALNSEFLEPDGNTNGSVQAQWLESHLAASTARWKLVYFHVPPYSSGAYWGSHGYMQWPFAEWGASAVFSGHDHLYERVLTNGIPYFVNGLGGVSKYDFVTNPIAGSQVRFNQDFGAMRVEATESNIVFNFVTEFDRVVDTYRIPAAPAGYPFFTRYPRGRTVRPNANVTFEATASGNPPPSYQWQFNGTTMTGETNSVLTLTNLQPEQAGSYAAIVSNTVGGLSVSARLTVLTEPTILRQPIDQTVSENSSTTFNVIAEGHGPLTYQWFHNGIELPGATNAFLHLSNVGLAQDGQYQVRVSDDLASVVSAAASLVVLPRLRFVQQPLSQSDVEGATVVFSVSVTPGALPISYRWLVGSRTLTNMIVNELSSFFTLTNVQSSNAGVYRVAVTNLTGTSIPTISGPAVLAVLSDDDRDGLPNVWEEAHALDARNADDARLDSDEDGMTNWQEYVAGTDPLDAASSLRMEILRVDAESPPLVKLSFVALSNQTYAVEHRSSTSSQSWSRLAEIVASVSNRMVQITNSIALTDPSQQLYRVVTPRLP
jgi:hypothetical protein